jgi:hypothetical protein
VSLSWSLVCLQDREHQFWCPAPLHEGEQHRRKLRSDKYHPLVARLLELYESDLSVEADEDTDVEVGTGGIAKSRRKTRSTVAKQSVSTCDAPGFHPGSLTLTIGPNEWALVK